MFYYGVVKDFIKIESFISTFHFISEVFSLWRKCCDMLGDYILMVLVIRNKKIYQVLHTSRFPNGYLITRKDGKRISMISEEITSFLMKVIGFGNIQSDFSLLLMGPKFKYWLYKVVCILHQYFLIHHSYKGSRCVQKCLIFIVLKNVKLD